MIIISYIASSIATVLGLIQPFGKKMKPILILTFTSNFLVALSYLMVNQLSGAAICFFACVQVFINYFFDAKNQKVPLWLIIIYSLVFIVVNLVTFTYWYDIFTLVASMLFVLSVAQSEAKSFRILIFANVALWILYDFFAKAYGNLATHIILLVATAISIIVRDKKLQCV